MISTGSENLPALRGEMAATYGMYGLLARIWQRELDSNLLVTLNQPELREVLFEAGLQVPNLKSTSVLDELAADFCRVFIGPRGHIPPHQSVWLEGTFQGELLESLNSYIEIISPSGIDFEGRPILDHAAAQLSLMQRILGNAENCSDQDLVKLNDLASQFFADHLLWLAAYCEVAASIAASGFYRSLLLLTRDFVNAEHSRFGK